MPGKHSLLLVLLSLIEFNYCKGVLCGTSAVVAADCKLYTTSPLVSLLVLANIGT